jgi:ATP-dependent helicase HrpA
MVRGFPAFVDVRTGVDLRVFATSAEQEGAMGPATRRLVRLSVSSPVKAVDRQLDLRTRLALGANPDGSLSALLDDCADAATDALVPGPVWTRDEFAALRDRVARDLVAMTVDIVGRVETALSAAKDVHLVLPDQPPPAQADAIADVRSQLERLLPPGFVTATGRMRLADLTRYLTAIRRRLDRLPHAIEADRERMQRVYAVQDAYDELVHALSPARGTAADVRDIAWQIEELRVSLWAQQLGTPRPVSEQRIYRAIDAVHDRS